MPDRSPQILLVEEDRTLLEITAFRLELLGYNVVTQQSAERALEWLREQLPTLIIVDHVLPGMDGIEFINRLSNDTRTSEIPIMFLSTHSDLEDVQRAYLGTGRRGDLFTAEPSTGGEHVSTGT